MSNSSAFAENKLRNEMTEEHIGWRLALWKLHPFVFVLAIVLGIGGCAGIVYVSRVGNGEVCVGGSVSSPGSSGYKV